MKIARTLLGVIQVIPPPPLSVTQISGRIVRAATVWAVPVTVFGLFTYEAVRIDLSNQEKGDVQTVKLSSRWTKIYYHGGPDESGSSFEIPFNRPFNRVSVWTSRDFSDKDEFFPALTETMIKWLSLSTACYTALLFVARGKETFGHLSAAAGAIGSGLLFGVDGVVAASTLILFVAGQDIEEFGDSTGEGYLFLGLGGLYSVIRGLLGLADAISPGCRMRALLKMARPFREVLNRNRR